MIQKTRKMTAVVEVTWTKRENDEQCGGSCEPHELANELADTIAWKLDTGNTEVETVAVLSLEEKALPCAHLVITALEQTHRGSGFSAWECTLADGRTAHVCYDEDALIVELDGKQVAREENLFGIAYKAMFTREMVDILGFGIEDQVGAHAS